MSNDTQTKAKRRPDYRVSAVVPGSQDRETRFVRLGVGFNLKKGGISVLTDGLALSGHLILTGLDDDLPSLEGLAHGLPQRPADFKASTGRESGQETFWTDIGQAWKHDTHISIHTAVLPHSGKFLLFPEDRED